MHERDAFLFWQEKGMTTLPQLVEQLQAALAPLPKANKGRQRELIALSTSLLKSICYKQGIKWAAMALHEHRSVKDIPEPVSIIRQPPPEPEPEIPEAPEAKSKAALMKMKKEELAEFADILQGKINEITKLEADNGEADE